MDVRDNVFSFLQEWYGRRDDILEDLEDNGFDVLEANDEYLVVEKDENQYDIRLGGTSRTITIDKIECIVEEGLTPVTEKLSKSDIEKEIIDCVGMGFETGHIVYDEFSEFEKEVGPGIEDINDPDFTTEDAWNFYNELINMGPGGFYNEYHDRYDFSKDFISEYGKDEYESEPEDDLIEIENKDKVLPTANYIKGTVYPAPEGPRVIWNALVTGTVNGESFNQYFTAYSKEDVSDFLANNYPELEVNDIDMNKGSYELETSGKSIIDLTGTKTESVVKEAWDDENEVTVRNAHVDSEPFEQYNGYDIYRGVDEYDNDTYYAYIHDSKNADVDTAEKETNDLDELYDWIEENPLTNSTTEGLIPIISEDVKEGVEDENEKLVFLHLDNIAELASNYEDIDIKTLGTLVHQLEDEIKALSKVYIEMHVGIKRYKL